MEALAQFDGNTYEAPFDHTRLASQLERVRLLMRDGRWRSLQQIGRITGDPEASVSAMTEQATWIPLPRRRSPKIKVDDAMERFNHLADWYTANKPSVSRISVTKGDYQAFKDAVGTQGIWIDDGVLRYRGFVVSTVEN